MANPTTNYGFIMPSSTDLVTDLPADFDVFGQAVDTQMLTNANAAIAKAIVDAKGDLISATAADTPGRLAVGANGTVLTADSGETTGLKWATPKGGLTLISATAVSAATAVNIDNVFTSTYTNYRIIYSGTASGGYNFVQLLYRAGGSTITAADYEGYVTRFNSASAVTQTNAYQNGTAGHEVVQAGPGMCIVADIFSPQATEYTSIVSDGVLGQIVEGRAIRVEGYGFFEDTTSFDGFRINAVTDTMTGTIFVYGYQKS